MIIRQTCMRCMGRAYACTQVYCQTCSEQSQQAHLGPAPGLPGAKAAVPLAGPQAVVADATRVAQRLWACGMREQQPMREHKVKKRLASLQSGTPGRTQYARQEASAAGED
jgi:hypothetical protein